MSVSVSVSVSVPVAVSVFASQFPRWQPEARDFEAKFLEFGIETMKVEFRAPDLPPEGSKQQS